jgi:hypothetical protein
LDDGESSSDEEKSSFDERRPSSDEEESSDERQPWAARPQIVSADVGEGAYVLQCDGMVLALLLAARLYRCAA